MGKKGGLQKSHHSQQATSNTGGSQTSSMPGPNFGDRLMRGGPHQLNQTLPNYLQPLFQIKNKHQLMPDRIKLIDFAKLKG